MGGIVVIGGGVVGAAATYHLARHGYTVTLIDRSDDGQATADLRPVDNLAMTAGSYHRLSMYTGPESSTHKDSQMPRDLQRESSRRVPTAAS